MKHTVLMVCLFAAVAGGQELLKRGADACNQGDLAAAVGYFQQAVNAEPQSLLARQHLANARLQQFLSTGSASERAALADAARKSLAEVLAREPQNALALWHMASLELGAGKPSEAAAWCRKLAGIEAQNGNAYYTLGVIRWMESFRALGEAKKKGGIPALRRSLLSSVAEGHRLLEKALAIDPEFANALLYDNLLYRIEADLANSTAEAQALLARADDQIKAAVALKDAGKPNLEKPGRLRPDAPPPPAAPAPPPPPPPPLKKQAIARFGNYS